MFLINNEKGVSSFKLIKSCTFFLSRRIRRKSTFVVFSLDLHVCALNDEIGSRDFSTARNTHTDTQRLNEWTNKCTADWRKKNTENQNHLIKWKIECDKNAKPASARCSLTTKKNERLTHRLKSKYKSEYNRFGLVIINDGLLLGRRRRRRRRLSLPCELFFRPSFALHKGNVPFVCSTTKFFRFNLGNRAEWFFSRSLRKREEKWAFLSISNENSHIKWWAQRFTFSLTWIFFRKNKLFSCFSFKSVGFIFNLCSCSSMDSSVSNGAALEDYEFGIVSLYQRT